MSRLARATIGLAAATLASVPLADAAAASAHDDVAFLDDAVRVTREGEVPASPWPAKGAIDLGVVAREETPVVQVVFDAASRPVLGAHVVVEGDGALDLVVASYAERFVHVARPSGNAKEAGSLAFTPKAAPDPRRTTGWLADALVPSPTIDTAAGVRSALWIDLFVATAARAGKHDATLRVVAGDGTTLAERPLAFEVLDAKLPYPGAAVTAFYDTRTLVKRMGADAAPAAERSLRQVLHAHRVGAIREITALDDPSLAVDDAALAGDLYTPARGYAGPGAGARDDVVAIGAYGALGDPDPTKLDAVAHLAERLRARGAFAFLYAADEDCDSPRPRAWKAALGARGVSLPVGVTCGDDPSAQAADLVMVTADRFDPKSVERARAAGKRVWVYNGRRPFAGPMMLDVPAVDLRANAWIAARYGVERWFYWESSFWLDANRGGKGGADGFDPFVVAETFHNADGDWANGDGILVYPGTQLAPGMTDDHRAEVYPSVRLAELRRGAEDAAWIALARAKDAAATDAVVRGVVGRALGEADEDAPPTWPDDPAEWRAARRALADVVLGRPVEVPIVAPRLRTTRVGATALVAGAAVAAGLVLLVLRRLRRARVLPFH